MSWRPGIDAQSDDGDDAMWEHITQVADRTRREQASRTLVDRLRQDWSQVQVVVASHRTLTGGVLDVGADWFALEGSDRREWLVPVAAVVELTGLAGPRLTEEPASLHRLGLGYPLRALARGRVPVLVDDVLGRCLTGTIDAVNADAIELSPHPVDQPLRRPSAVPRRILALSALACVGGPIGRPR